MVIEGIPLVGLSAPAILLLVVVLILRGQLIPRRTYDDIKEDRDQWRDNCRQSEAARSMQDQQILELIEQSRTSTGLLQSIAAAARVRNEGPL
jgi:hypothetical protein